MLMSWALYALAAAACAEGGRLRPRSLRLGREDALDDCHDTPVDNGIAEEEWGQAAVDDAGVRPCLAQTGPLARRQLRMRTVTVFSTTTAVTVVTIPAETPITSSVVATVTDIQTVVEPPQGGAAETITVTTPVSPQRRAAGQVDTPERRDSKPLTVTSVLTVLERSVVTETPTIVVTSTDHILNTITIPAPVGSTSTVLVTVFVGADGLPMTPPRPTAPIALPATDPSITPAAAAAAAAAAGVGGAPPPLLAPTVATDITVVAFVGTLVIILTFIFCLWGRNKNRGDNGGFGGSLDDEERLSSPVVPAATAAAAPAAAAYDDGDKKEAGARARASARFSASSGTLINTDAMERGRKAWGDADEEPTKGPKWRASYRESVRIMFKIEDIEKWEDLERWEKEEPRRPAASKSSSPRGRRPDMYRHPSALPPPLALGQGDTWEEKGATFYDSDDDDEGTVIGSDIMQMSSSWKAKQPLPAIPPPARVRTGTARKDGKDEGEMPGFV